MDGRPLWRGRKFLTRPSDLDRLWADLDVADPGGWTPRSRAGKAEVAGAQLRRPASDVRDEDLVAERARKLATVVARVWLVPAGLLNIWPR